MRMRATLRPPSGTFLWSALPANGMEAIVWCGSGQGGDVSDGLPLRHDDQRGQFMQVVQ